jgi:GT2 family glycosyltransferase
VARLLISIVNYRVAPLVVECLRSLEPEVTAAPGTRVVVVDNASGDGSCQAIQAAIDSASWGGWAELLPRQVNDGFSAGNNAAIRPALASPEPPDFVFLLNPDARVLPGALRALLEFAAQHPQAGLLGSRILDEEGRVQRSAFRFPSVRGELLRGVRLGLLDRLWAEWVVAPPPRDHAHRADWISGAAMLIRRELLEQAGLLDEAYFLYYEELDLCLRAQRAGWECWYVPQSQVVHHEGRSTGISGDDRLRRRPAYWFASRKRYFAKHHGACYARAVHTSYATGLLLWKLRRLVEGKRREDPPHFLRDLIRRCLL